MSRSLSAHRFLADENIPSTVVTGIRERGHVFRSAADELGNGTPDDQVLRYAYAEGPVVVTQDRDFGRLAIRDRAPLLGIIYLYPGTLDARKLTATLAELLNAATFPDLSPPFLLVASRHGGKLKIRYRRVHH